MPLVTASDLKVEVVYARRLLATREEEFCCSVKLNLGLIGNRAGDRRKYVVRVGTNQTNRADHDDQNDGQHHGIFCHVLPSLIGPELS